LQVQVTPDDMTVRAISRSGSLLHTFSIAP
jgi:hypothetical protein